MQQCKLISVVTILVVCAVALYGCFGGGGGGGSTSVFKSNSTINGYVFVPEGSVGKRGMTQPLAVQAPPGMVPLVGATVKLSDGTVTITDNNGRYEFKIKVEAVEGETKSVEVWINETGTEKITYEVKVEIDKYTVCSAKLEDLNGDGKLDVKEIIAPPPTIVKPGSGGEDDPEEIIPVIIAATYEFAGLQEVTDLQTGGEVQLSWTAPTLPSTLANDIPMVYSVYASKTSSEYDFAAAPAKTVTDGAVTTTVSGLDNDTYYFVVRAKTSKGKIEDEPNTVEESVVITDATAPTFDGIQAVTMGDGQAIVYWDEGTDNTGPLSYKVYYHTAPPATGGTGVAVSDPTASSGQYQFQHTITGLTNGTTYYFIIHALDAVSNEDDNAVEESGVPKSIPGAPENVEANLGYEKIVVSWDIPSDTGGDTITSYKVYRGLSAESVSLLASGITETSYDDGAGDASPLVVDQTYYYKVKAVNNIGDGPLSTDASATYMLVPPSPQNLRASNVTTTGFTFEWDDVDGEDGYRVYMEDEQQGSDFVADSTSAVLSGLTTNTAYNMEVLAFNVVGPGNESSLVVETLPPAPTEVESSDITSTGFSVSWTAVSGDVVDGYRVYVDGTQYGNDVTSGTIIAVTGLNSGTTYSIEVSAFTGGGAGEAGGEGEKSSPAVEVLTEPAAPTGLADSDVTTTSFTLDWSAVSGEVDGYRVYKDGVQYGSDTTETSMSVTGLTAGATYSMQVAAYNDTGEGEKSTATPVETRPEAPSNVTSGNITASSFTISWDAVTGADGYRVYVDSSQYGTDVTSGISLSVPGRTAGTSYSVEVSAYTDGGEGAKSSPAVEVLTLPDAPTGLAPSNLTTTGFTLSWDAVSGTIDGYRVYKDDVQYGTATTETSMAISDLTANTTYSMKVSAFNTTDEGDKSEALDVTTSLEAPAAIEGADVTNLSTSGFDLQWDPVSGTVDGYRVYLDGVQYNGDITSGTSTQITGLETTDYPMDIQVSAYKGENESEKSSPAYTVELNYVQGSVTPSGCTVQLWQSGVKVKDDEDADEATYLFSDYTPGSYIIRAYKRDDAKHGYYKEKSVTLPSGATTENIETSEITLGIEGSQFTAPFYGNATLNGTAVRIGDYVTVQDQSGIECGLWIVGTAGEYGNMTVYGEDPLVEGDQGADEGETLIFLINGITCEQEPTFNVGGSTYLDISAPITQ